MKKILICTACLLLLLGVGLSAWQTHLRDAWADRFFPGVSVDGISLQGKTLDEAKSLLASREYPAFTITLEAEKQSVASTSAELGVTQSIDETLTDALAEGKSDHVEQLVIRFLFPERRQRNFQTTPQFNPEKLTQIITALKNKVDILGQEPAATLAYSGSAASLRVGSGKIGREVNLEETRAKLTALTERRDSTVTAVVQNTAHQLTNDELKTATERAKKLVGKELTLRAENVYHQLTDRDIIPLLTFPTGVNQTKIDTMVAAWTKDIDREPQEPVLEYDTQTLAVKKFQPPRKGLQVDRHGFTQSFIGAIEVLEQTETKNRELAIPVTESSPKSQLSDTNKLGIVDRIGFGESLYEHSIPNRIHNVALTASRINNTIVKPGEEFSFNRTLGEVSGATGFRTAYVIRNGRTELGDGGGVCQVSTTLFRSVLNAGLPVTKRKPHSYRVSYYELNAKPGIDATVYAGDTDLRFINDTGHHILIHTQTDSKKLYMTVEIYGMSDGRTTEIIDHKTWDFVGAPAPLYISDPSLPAGTIRQIDFAASGIKASFKNVVKDRNGRIIRTEEYFSNYKPWRAVFLRGG